MDDSARFRCAVSAARPRGQRLIEAYSPKLGRRVQCFGEAVYRQWIRLEADPSVELLCERPAFLQLANERRLADFWVRQGASELFLILGDPCPQSTVDLDETALPVQCVTPAELAAARIWIANWERMLPVMTASRGLVSPSLQQALLKLISKPVPLARIEQECAVGDPTAVRAALFGLLHQGALQAPLLKTEILSYSTCFEPLGYAP